MKKLIKKIIKFFREMFSSDREMMEGGNANTDLPEERPTPPPGPPSPVKPEEPKPSPKPDRDYGTDSHGNTISDPWESNPEGTIKSILYKERADHPPHHPVIIVDCLDIRGEDLYPELIGRGRKVLKVDFKMTGRANGNRIHFRPNKSGERLSRSAPLKLRFYQIVNGERKVVTYRGRKTVTIPDPTDRAEFN
jgi:hypothetical protein